MNSELTDCEISKSQAILIQKLFKRFNFNKIQNKQKGEVLKSKALFKDEWSFKPKLSTYSNHLAEKIRDHSYTGNYKFYESMISKMKQTNEWKVQEQQKKEEEMMREWTFTPEIHSRSNMVSRDSANRKSQRILVYDKSAERWNRHQHDYESSHLDDNDDQEQAYNKGWKRNNKSAIILKHAKYNRISKKSVERNIQRIREANREKDVVRLMRESKLLINIFV